ncbi:lactate/malate family dehydrogenase [Kitasatospora camelliae]|uniref:Malate dehydrogenase n=1 Tax=Kitasatospora camelliae TaxID=3156397 RepID=A0AAU8K084_9ACTN
MARTGKVTVVGAGAQGAAIAHRLAERDVLETVVLTDAIEGRAEGAALDINHCRPLTGHRTRVLGVTCGPDGDDYRDTAGSDLVVLAAGRRPEPGGSRAEHLATNAALVREMVAPIAELSPDAVLLVVANPVAELTAVAHRASGFPASRVIGQSTALDTARFTHFLAEELDVEPGLVRAVALGWHGEDLIPAISACEVDGRPLDELLSCDELEELVERTRYAGPELVSLLGGGGGLRAPAVAAAAVALAVIEDAGRVLPVCAWVDGRFGIDGVWLGVQAELGAQGVNKVVETPLAPAELAALRTAADAARTAQRLVDPTAQSPAQSMAR